MIKTWRVKNPSGKLPIIDSPQTATTENEPSSTNKLYGFNKTLTTSNIASHCTHDNNIRLLECQQYCPLDDPDDRAPWCDSTIKKYCQTSQGKVDSMCACINSTLPLGIPVACFDPVCAESGYKLYEHFPAANQCANFCHQILEHPIAKNLDSQQIAKICQTTKSDPPSKAKSDPPSSTSNTNLPLSQQVQFSPSIEYETGNNEVVDVNPSVSNISFYGLEIGLWVVAGVLIIVFVIIIFLVAYREKSKSRNM